MSAAVFVNYGIVNLLQFNFPVKANIMDVAKNKEETKLRTHDVGTDYCGIAGS